MSPEKQRVVIAEWRGWVWKKGELSSYPKKGHSYEWIDPQGFGWGFCYLGDRTENQAKNEVALTVLPNFCEDLNAIHRMERELDQERAGIYANLLDWVCDAGEYSSHFATASQRAEAFLRTVGRWEE